MYGIGDIFNDMFSDDLSEDLKHALNGKQPNQKTFRCGKCNNIFYNEIQTNCRYCDSTMITKLTD